MDQVFQHIATALVNQYKAANAEPSMLPLATQVGADEDEENENSNHLRIAGAPKISQSTASPSHSRYCCS